MADPTGRSESGQELKVVIREGGTPTPKPAGQPEVRMVTITIDGVPVSAPEGAMLVDGAKYGDVEIPVFCYEPKLGQPVGACRMCLVEIEGIPKLQTACSTPVRDGMSVITQSPRVKEAQNSVVEFLLVNHPLDCPVCDKGGECPLQDISMGWGRGTSRMVEPKRHFEKPVALSPNIAIDRERCILCYRCVRYSQEITEDYQLVLLDRGDHSFVGTFDNHPYVAPFSGNIIDLCPVGALTSRAYRFRARPWEIESGGSVCTLCPSQCNLTFTVRDDQVMRAIARDNAEVDDGWLCDKGRFAYQSWKSDQRITKPLLREGDRLYEVSWERAISAAVDGLKKAGAKTAALVGGQTTNEEGWLTARLVREALGSPHIETRRDGALDGGLARLLAQPELTATVPDIEWADAVLVLDTELVDEMPILDLRIRKALRRHGMKLAIATGRPSALDAGAHAVARFAPGAGEAFVQALTAALTAGADGARGDDAGELDRLSALAGATSADVAAVADQLRGAERVVIVWGERLSDGTRGNHAVRALINVTGQLGLADVAGAGLLEVPSGTNDRGLREIGVASNLGPGLADATTVGKSAPEIAEALAEGELAALILMHVNPLVSYPDRGAWQAALAKAGFVVSFANWRDEAVERHANVVFPAESNSEKEGTVTHPDGRVQRVRPVSARPEGVRMEWQVLAEICAGLGLDTGVITASTATRQIAAAVPFYAGLTVDEIGGKGVRWQDRPAASALPAAVVRKFDLESPPALADSAGRLRLGTYRPLWSGGDVVNAETLAFLDSGQRLELSGEDGERLGVKTGDRVTVSDGDEQLLATVALRDAVPPGSAFLLEIGADSGTVFTNGVPALVEVRIGDVGGVES